MQAWKVAQYENLLKRLSIQTNAKRYCLELRLARKTNNKRKCIFEGIQTMSFFSENIYKQYNI